MSTDQGAFQIAANRAQALAKVERLAQTLQVTLRAAGYTGPVCIAGGYVRDVALGKTPKDLDVFLDGGSVKESGASVKAMAEALAATFPTGSRFQQVIPCYGGWATDIDLVAKVHIERSEGMTFTDTSLPIPESLDLIVMRREALMGQGYEPGNPGSLLDKVIARVDLRLNAIGATPYGSSHSPAWDFDALNHRLVVQYARRDDPQARIDKRLVRLSSGKFAGWSTLYEGPAGELSPVSAVGLPEAPPQ